MLFFSALIAEKDKNVINASQFKDIFVLDKTLNRLLCKLDVFDYKTTLISGEWCSFLGLGSL